MHFDQILPYTASLKFQEKTNVEELLDKEFPCTAVEVDMDMARLILSNQNAMADSQAQLGIGSIVIGTVQSLKPCGASIDIGEINGLLHVSKISHDRVCDIETVIQPGDKLKFGLVGVLVVTVYELLSNFGRHFRGPVFFLNEQSRQILILDGQSKSRYGLCIGVKNGSFRMWKTTTDRISLSISFHL